MKNKISTFKIVGNSFSFIKKNFGIYASISFLPILLSFIVDLFYQNLVIHFTVPLFIFLFSSYIYVRLAINIHNFAIFGIMPDSYFENLWNKKIKWFWIYAIIIGTPGTIAGFFLPLFIAIPIFSILIKLFLISVFYILIIWFIIARFSLIFPSVAVGDNVSLFEFGKTTKGARLTIIFQFIILLLTVMIISIPQEGLYNTFHYSDQLYFLLNNIVIQFGIVLMITNLSFTYKEWKQTQSN